MKLHFLLPLFICAVCNAASPSNGYVVFLGDDARMTLSANCNDGCIPYDNEQIKVPSANSSASDAANAAKNAKHGILVVDAANGPLQVTREHILIARQAGVPALSILVVNTSALDGLKDKSELIKQQITEVRELLNKYEMRGNTAEVFFDYTGLKNLISKTVLLPPRKTHATGSSRSRRVSAFIYNLSSYESNKAEPIMQDKRIVVWLNGQTVSGSSLVNAKIEPGRTGEMGISFDKPIYVSPGLRFFIERDKRIVSAGVVISIK